jgi:hypothetical protein
MNYHLRFSQCHIKFLYYHPPYTMTCNFGTQFNTSTHHDCTREIHRLSTNVIDQQLPHVRKAVYEFLNMMFLETRTPLIISEHCIQRLTERCTSNDERLIMYRFSTFLHGQRHDLIRISSISYNQFMEICSISVWVPFGRKWVFIALGTTGSLVTMYICNHPRSHGGQTDTVNYISIYDWIMMFGAVPIFR